MSPTARFLYWCKERHEMYRKKLAGLPKPWTDDIVLRDNYFTNPYRENDRTTVWMRDAFRAALAKDNRVLMATIIFRWFNKIETGIVLTGGPGVGGGKDTCPPVKYGWLEKWDGDAVLERLDRERRAGVPVFTGAYKIYSPGGKGKLEAVCEMIDAVWDDRENLLDRLTRIENPSLEYAHGVLKSYKGMGKFMAYEVVCDLRYTMFLRNAPDILTWCNPGPGAIRGILRLQEIDFPKGDNERELPRPKNWTQLTQDLLKRCREFCLKNGMPLFEMREVEHSLCEWDKYERERLGDGRMRRRYAGNPS